MMLTALAAVLAFLPHPAELPMTKGKAMLAQTGVREHRMPVCGKVNMSQTIHRRAHVRAGLMAGATWAAPRRARAAQTILSACRPTWLAPTPRLPDEGRFPARS